MKSYANRTRVPVQQTRNEVEQLLLRAGASSVGVLTDATLALVAFKLQGRAYRMAVPLPSAKSMSEAQRMQAMRQRWRALWLVLRAKIESAQSGITTLEVEMMPYAVMPSGRTVAEEVLPRLAAAYESGRDVPLLPQQ